MSPWELIAVYLIVPVLVVGGWLHHRYETDGPSIPEFEAWCHATRPVLFAMRAKTPAARAFAEAIGAAIGPRGEVEHHGGRFPWPSYVFKLSVEIEQADDRAIVRVRAVNGVVRKKRLSFPELSRILDGALAATKDIDAVWMHTELRDGDDTRGEARRGRGWIAIREGGDGGALGEFALAAGAPAWLYRSPSDALSTSTT